MNSSILFLTVGQFRFPTLGLLEMGAVSLLTALTSFAALHVVFVFQDWQSGERLNLKPLMAFLIAIISLAGAIGYHAHRLNDTVRPILLETQQTPIKYLEGHYYQSFSDNWIRLDLEDATFETTPELANELVETAYTVDYWPCRSPKVRRFAGCRREVNQVIRFNPEIAEAANPNQ